ETCAWCSRTPRADRPTLADLAAWPHPPNPQERPGLRARSALAARDLRSPHEAQRAHRLTAQLTPRPPPAPPPPPRPRRPGRPRRPPPPPARRRAWRALAGPR